MKFWDSSAIVPLCLDQKPEHTRLARSLFDDDEDLVVWWGTVVECASAFDRLRRTGGISDKWYDCRGCLRARFLETNCYG